MQGRESTSTTEKMLSGSFAHPLARPRQRSERVASKPCADIRPRERCTSPKPATVALMALPLVVCLWLLAPPRALAVGVAFCYLKHGEAGDETEYRTTVKYALMERESRSEAKKAAYADVEATLQQKYAHLIGKTVYEHGESIDGPECDTWAFSSGYGTLIETKFSNFSYTFHNIVAGVGTTADAATANAIKNLGMHNWGWSLDAHGYQGVSSGGSGTSGDLAVGEVDPP